MALSGIVMDSTIRTPSERERLIEAIFKAPTHEPELDWVEWKSRYDLASAADQFKLAKHILGFSNRQPDRAAAMVGGCAYLVCGVEPGDASGIAPVDSAVLTKGIGRYTGTAGPRWNPDYVRFHGQTVLVITVEPPAWGDPIHTLQQGYNNALPGTIYVRRNGLTEQANPAEVNALAARSSRRAAQVELTVRWLDEQPEAVCYDATDSAAEAWVAAERSHLMAQLENRPPTGLHLAMLEPMVQPEKRTPEDYNEEVESYLAAGRESFADRVRLHASGSSKPFTALIDNFTDRNFEAVEVELAIAGPVHAFFDLDQARTRLHADLLPRRPRPYGPRLFQIPDLSAGLATLGPYALRQPQRRGWIDNSGSTRIDFEAVHMRPQSRIALPAFLVIADSTLAGQQLQVLWSLTAKNADGRQSGALQIRVQDEVVRVRAGHDTAERAEPDDDSERST
jgi:hypothetical protein